MFEALSKRDKILLLIVLIAGVGFCLYHFILVSQYKTYVKVKNELSQSQAQLNEDSVVAASFKSESEKLDKVKKEIKDAGRRFETEMRDGSSVIILGLDGIFEDVDITSLEPGEIKEEPYLLDLPMQIIAQGNYVKMLSFCKDIEKLTNFTEVRGIKMEAILGTGMIKTTIDVNIYSAKTPTGMLNISELSRWLTGKSDVFQPSTMIPPIPELAGKIIKPAGPKLDTDSQPVNNETMGSTNATMGEPVPAQSETP